MNGWDLEGIAQALGVAFRETKPGVHSALIINKSLGVRTRLEVAPEQKAARVWADRDRSTKPSFIGRVDYFNIKAVSVEEDQVVFSGGTQANPNELLVTANGTFRVVIGIKSERVAGIPVEEVETPHDPELLTLCGKIGRPNYSESSGKPFFRAGLGIMEDGATAMTWLTVKAWNGVAVHAQHLERGAMARVTGRMQEETYTSREGEEVTQHVLHATFIERCD